MNETSRSERIENPRTTRVRELVLKAAVELLLSGGPREVTATRVAEETGVARTTIYRQWPDQPSLLLATIDTLTAPHSPAPDSGELHDDLTAVLANLRTRLVTRNVLPILAALLDNASRDAAFVASQRRFVGRMVQPTIDVLVAAQDRGSLPATLDCSVAATVLTGPIFHQYLLMQKTIEDDLIYLITSQFVEAHTTA